MGLNDDEIASKCHDTYKGISPALVKEVIIALREAGYEITKSEGQEGK